MIALVLALAASLSWGSSDFLAGTQTRRTSLWTALLVTQTSGMFLMTAIALLRGHAPTTQVLLPSLAAGMATVVAVAASYQALAIGVMSIVGPILSLCTAVPVIVGLASGERPSALQSVGICVALGGVILASRQKSAGRHHPATSGLSISLAALAAAAYGFMMVFYAAAAESDPYWSVALARATSASALAVAFAVRRPALKLTRSALLPLVVAGTLAAGGNALFAVATLHGYLSVVSVLSAIAPVFVVILAYLLLRERLSPTQRLGVASALIGVALIAAG